MEFLLCTLIAILFGWGLWRVGTSTLYHDHYSTGRKSLQQIGKWYKEKQELWDKPLFKRATDFLTRIVYLDDTAKMSLARQLHRAGMDLTPEQFAARKYIVYAVAGVGMILCVLLQFWFGVIICALAAVYGVMRQRESLTARIKARDEAIEMEMPRFVRTICRTLHNNRDIHAALTSYHKVAGPILGEEIYILLTQMRTGGVSVALQEFQKRIGTDAAFRLCSTLQEIDRGIDQTGTLEYLADDMARQARLNIQKTLSTRPGKMRATYLPAVGVCVVMIIYVLIVFVMNQLNNLY